MGPDLGAAQTPQIMKMNDHGAKLLKYMYTHVSQNVLPIQTYIEYYFIFWLKRNNAGISNVFLVLTDVANIYHIYLFIYISLLFFFFFFGSNI